MTQQSPDMVERVARALHRAHYESGRGLAPPYPSDKFEQEHWRFRAQAALEASHHAELVEALRESRDTLFAVARSLPAQSHAHGVTASGGRRIAALIAKIGGGA